MTALATRAAAASDATLIAALVNRAFAIEKAFTDGERTSIEEIRALMAKGMFLLADDDAGPPYACAYVEQRGYRAYLGMLSIDPDRQGQGLGRRMLTAVESYCRARRVRAMDIRILSLRAELPPFYRKLGYVEAGTAPCENSLLLKPAHYILMSKNLE